MRRLEAVPPSHALVLLAIAFGLAQLPAIGRRPVFGYISSFTIVIGAAFLVPAIMDGLARFGRAFLRRRLGVEGLLAHANLTSAIPACRSPSRRCR